MHGFKSAILAKMKNCQNGTFEPVREIQNFFWPKVFFFGELAMALVTTIGMRFLQVCFSYFHGPKSTKLKSLYVVGCVSKSEKLSSILAKNKLTNLVIIWCMYVILTLGYLRICHSLLISISFITA